MTTEPPKGPDIFRVIVAVLLTILVIPSAWIGMRFPAIAYGMFRYPDGYCARSAPPASAPCLQEPFPPGIPLFLVVLGVLITISALALWWGPWAWVATGRRRLRRTARVLAIWFLLAAPIFAWLNYAYLRGSAHS